MQFSLNKLARLSLAARIASLVSVVLLLYVLVAPVAFTLNHWTGLIAAAFAGGLCMIGALAALTICHCLHGPQQALYGLLLGMAMRMGIPLACGLAIYLQGGTLAQAGFLYYLLVFYPITLAVETTLSLPDVNRTEHHPGVPRNLTT